MPREPLRLQRVPSQFGCPELELVRHRRASGPGFWEAEFRLPGVPARIYRSTRTCDLEEAQREALRLYMEARAPASTRGSVGGLRFSRLREPYRAFLDRKIADLRGRLSGEPDLLRRKIQSVEKNWSYFANQILPYFKNLPISS